MSEYVDININRHGGNKQSNKANVKVAPHKQNWRSKILGLMSYRESLGKTTTLKDACIAFGKERGQISGRFTELKAKELIEPNGKEREGFAEYVIKK